MSVMDMNSRMAMAEKLSVQQLQQAVQSGSLPAYIGIPLIEQKTKEKAQMAAAQGGQEQPPSVAASILQQAEQQEQAQGINQLPSNLPVMDDQEMGMAGGGIVAFAEPTEQNNNSLVTDPEQDPRIVALRQDPSYLAFAENATAEGKDASLTAFLQAGNDTSTPVRYPLTDRERQNIRDRMELQREQLQSAAQQARDAYSPNNASINNRAPGVPMGEVFGTYADKAQRVLQGNESNVPSDLRAYSDRGMFSGIPLGGPDSRPPAAPDDNESDVSNMDPQLVAPDMERRNFPPQGNAGITAAPGAKSVNPVVPGAPRTASQGGGDRQSALPPSLAAAERSDSPAANQATSMLDKYIAQLEKSGESVGRDKKEALYMALIQGGLGMMGGTSPNAFANIAAGLLPATQAYQQSMRDIKKDDRARIEKLINAGLSKEKFAMELRKLGIEDKKADAMINYYNARAGAAGAGGSGDKDSRQLRQLAFQANSKYLETQRDAPKLKNTQEYKDAASILTMPLPKNASPLMVDRRKQAQQIVDDVNSQIKGRVNEARIARDFWSSEANFDPAKMYSRSASGKEDVDLNQFFK